MCLNVEIVVALHVKIVFNISGQVRGRLGVWVE